MLPVAVAVAVAVAVPVPVLALAVVVRARWAHLRRRRPPPRADQPPGGGISRSARRCAKDARLRLVEARCTESSSFFIRSRCSRRAASLAARSRGHADPVLHQAMGPDGDRVEQPELARLIVGRNVCARQMGPSARRRQIGPSSTRSVGRGFPCSIIPRSSGLRRPRRPGLALARLLPGLREGHHARGAAPDRHQGQRHRLPPRQTHHLQSPFRQGDRRRRDHPGRSTRPPRTSEHPRTVRRPAPPGSPRPSPRRRPPMASSPAAGANPRLNNRLRSRSRPFVKRVRTVPTGQPS